MIPLETVYQSFAFHVGTAPDYLPQRPGTPPVPESYPWLLNSLEKEMVALARRHNMHFWPNRYYL